MAAGSSQSNTGMAGAETGGPALQQLVQLATTVGGSLGSLEQVTSVMLQLLCVKWQPFTSSVAHMTFADWWCLDRTKRTSCRFAGTCIPSGMHMLPMYKSVAPQHI